jgi:hypothetical protein
MLLCWPVEGQKMRLENISGEVWCRREARDKVTQDHASVGRGGDHEISGGRVDTMSIPTVKALTLLQDPVKPKFWALSPGMLDIPQAEYTHFKQELTNAMSYHLLSTSTSMRLVLKTGKSPENLEQ